jgi:AraC family transcriptional regulator, positive regulator of tynA and feaB
MAEVAHRSGYDTDMPRMDFEAWQDLFQSTCGRFNPQRHVPAAFTGWARPASVFGFSALDLASNTRGVQRDYRDIRVDGMDQYYVLFQAAGRTMSIDHNGRAVQFGAGDVMLLDAARPTSGVAVGDGDAWNVVSINLPRQALASHLGFHLEGGLCGRSGTPAGRLLLELIRNSAQDAPPELSPRDSYMQFVIYDLVGALFAPTEPTSGSRHADKLFARIVCLIRENFADPDFGPPEAAAKAGISLRYLHKLFTERGLTCEQFIYARRLDHAVHLLRRHASLGVDRPLSEIAYSCGFRDYTHFARGFRRRFGSTPGAMGAGATGNDSARVRTDIGQNPKGPLRSDVTSRAGD